ncbi:MAG: energy-coupling factor ABC transporter permease [Vicinamibacteria bacterium]
MHIAEGFLPPLHALAWSAVALPAAVGGGRAIVRLAGAEDDTRARIAAAGGFCLLLSSLKLPSFAGSCSHPTGVGLGALLVGPAAMGGLALVVLAYQSLLLAHGGITTLGANLVALGVVGPWAAWAVHRTALALRFPGGAAVALAAAVGSLGTYATTSVQLGLAFPDATGGRPAAVFEFASLFLPVQLPLALGEGALTAIALGTLARRERRASTPGLEGPRP